MPLKYTRPLIISLLLVLVFTVVSLFMGLGYIPEWLFAQLTGSAPRALLSIAPESSTFGVGEDVVVSVMLSARTKVNLTDVLLRYPSDKLEPIRVSKENSIANLWIGEPSIPGKLGMMRMTAGIIGADAFTGKGKLLTITFRAKSEGAANLALTDGSVLAHDGSGTNVLDLASGAEYKILASPVARSPFDLNNDRIVDLKDARVFIDGWGKAYDPTLDFNANQKVEFDDFLALVRAISP
jgi:hypothetical protein